MSHQCVTGNFPTDDSSIKAHRRLPRRRAGDAEHGPPRNETAGPLPGGTGGELENFLGRKISNAENKPGAAAAARG